ncbi:hypothetical protein Phum_PHUM471750 [Pediculus humanus corporis]|uniref:Uncharacterized protein n=1 Tax=Pediculus humanus subsp. corporis TaxID=121224 RepID=E0VVY5_PEDHC|nr:uncharacterized protein Phum_PHUM471750 [Pediculus humanus corporis]EEB17541.1 hypothetical protein Phum_PHUM471750 [Pediculus humanus corporis]
MFCHVVVLCSNSESSSVFSLMYLFMRTPTVVESAERRVGRYRILSESELPSSGHLFPS